MSNLALPTRVPASGIPRLPPEVAVRALAVPVVKRRAGLSSDTIVPLVLYSVVALLLGFVSLSRPRPAAPGSSGLVEAVSGQLLQLRTEIQGFRSLHGCWPPSLVVLGSEVQAERGAGWVGNLEGAVAAAPEPGSTDPTDESVLANRINGLSTVWILSPAAPSPEAADGTTGWIYSPKTGQVWINALGFEPASGKRWFDF